jgi:hypothetical protein
MVKSLNAASSFADTRAFYGMTSGSRCARIVLGSGKRSGEKAILETSPGNGSYSG